MLTIMRVNGLPDLVKCFLVWQKMPDREIVNSEFGLQNPCKKGVRVRALLPNYLVEEYSLRRG
jgi:hypothetical protein